MNGDKAPIGDDSGQASDSCRGCQEATADSRSRDTVRRLRRIEGQVRGIQRMLEQGRECGDVLTQLMAIRSGLDEVSLLLVDLHIDRCILDGTEIDPSRRERLVRALRLMTRVPLQSPVPLDS